MTRDPFKDTPEELKKLQDAMKSGDVEAIRQFAESRHNSLEAGLRRRFELPAWEPGVKSRTVSEHPTLGRLVTTHYEPSPTPPADYPPSIPFFPDAACGVSVVEATGEPVMLMWMGVPDAIAAFNHIVSEAAKSGWTFKPSRLESPLGQSGLLERAGRKRIVTAASMFGQSTVLLQDVPEESP